MENFTLLRKYGKTSILSLVNPISKNRVRHANINMKSASIYKDRFIIWIQSKYDTLIILEKFRS